MTTDTNNFKISGELTSDPMVCHFHCDYPILDNWTISFKSPEESLGSPLIDALFAIEGVSAVFVSGSSLTVTKTVATPWPHMAADIAKAIRGACTGESAPINAAVIERLKNLPMDDAQKAIEELFEKQINPALESHGGYVKLVKIEDRDVYVEMGGGCQGCASARATMRNGVEGAIRSVAPQVRNIIDATDHDAGADPYYK